MHAISAEPVPVPSTWDSSHRINHSITQIFQAYSHSCQCVFVFLPVSWAFIFLILLKMHLFTHVYTTRSLPLSIQLLSWHLFFNCVPTYVPYIYFTRLVLTSSYIYYAAIFHRFSSLLWNFVRNTKKKQSGQKGYCARENGNDSHNEQHE